MTDLHLVMDAKYEKWGGKAKHIVLRSLKSSFSQQSFISVSGCFTGTEIWPRSSFPLTTLTNQPWHFPTSSLAACQSSRYWADNSSDTFQFHLPFLNNSSRTNYWEADIEINLGYWSQNSFWKLLVISRKHPETAQRLNRVRLGLPLTQH